MHYQPEDHERGWGIFFKFFCFEMVHFGAEVTNDVHHDWFSGSHSEKTDLRLIKFFCQNFGGGGWTRKTTR